MADAGAGPMIRDGVRRHRQAIDRGPRRRRDLLRPAVHHDALGRRQQPADVRDRSRPVLSAAEPRGQRTDDRRRAVAGGDQARRQPAHLGAVERRYAVRAAVGHQPRRFVHRPAQVPRVPGREPQRRGLRRGLCAGEPGLDPGAQHDARRDGRHHQPAARLQGLRRDHPTVGRAWRDSHAPVSAGDSGTGWPSVQRHDGAVR